jgi:3-hydroxy acid dehydrogenase/malonic semialdehyde reductase
MKKIAFITGATSGIGKATALRLAPDYNLILCGRRQDRLDELKADLKETTEVHTLSFDVRDRKSVFAAVASLPESWQDVDVLVNNAGNAHGLSMAEDADLDDWDAMIDINVKGLLYVTKALMPNMVARKSGFIVNIGSIAGKEVYQKGNVYCASKFSVDAITTGLRMDLNQYGIRVCAINPGLVQTEFSLVRFKGDADRASKVYDGFTPLYGDDIADAISYVISRPPHVMVADLTIFPTAQASATIVNKG